MGWSAQDIEKLRKKNGSQSQTAASQKATQKSTAAPAGTTGSQSIGWSAEKIDALRTGGSGTAKATADAWVNRGAGTSTRTGGTAKNSTGSTGSLGAQVLAQMNGTQTPAAGKKNGTGSGKLQLAGQTAQPEWLTKAQPGKTGTQKTTAPAATVRGTVKPTESQKAQARRSGSEGVLAKGAQAIKDHTEKAEAEDKFSDFTRLNQWMDADPKHRTLVSLMRQGKSGMEDAAALGSSTGDNATARQEYSPGELLKMGYTAKEISEAKTYIKEYDALPTWEKAVRRTADTAKGIGGTVAAAAPLAGEALGTALWNIEESANNRKALAAEVEKNPREKNLYDRLMETDMDYQPKYSTGDLLQQGFTRQEIDSMRARIAGTEASEGVDKDESVGYQLYDYGKKHTERAQSGMNPTAQVAMNVASSAAENLAVAGISPALVLPVLSAQGGAEAMGQSIEQGDSAGKTLAGGLAKFGAGWAINSVGAADLAKTMGSDYAKGTLAGKLADVVRSVADNGVLAQQYPTVANAISGGMDNAMQAFVETYADKAIDAALGDEQAAQEMFNRDTFLTALESGLSGGASGALGGAVGTQLGKMRAALETADGQTGSKLPQSPAGDSSLSEGALGTETVLTANDQQVGTAAQRAEETAMQPQTAAPAASETAAEQTAAPAVQSDNPAVQQLAEAMDSGTLTGKTINLFTPNAANEANRTAFEEAYGVQLPETAAKTRQMLRQMEAEQSAQKTQTVQKETGQQAQEESEPQGTGTELKNGVLTTWNADGTVERRVVDPEVAARAQAETLAAKQTVENAGETVETPSVSRSLDSSLGEGAFAQQAEPGTMRETTGLQMRSESAQKSSVEKELQRWKVTEGAAKTMSRNMPAGIADESRYAAAASSLYRLGQMEDVKTFDKAMELARGAKSLAVNTDYVLAQPGGETALKIAWLQGKGEAEAGTVQTGTLGGALSEKSLTGSGRVLYKGTMRTASEVATQLIELNARATDTDAVLKAVLEGDERVKAYVDTAAGQIFFADSAGDVFGTVLHEDWHWYNALDTEGAKALQQHVLEYLAKSEGYENVDELIRAKLSDYAQQNLTYGEAAEELVADAWRGIFDSEESFKSWVEFQRGQAEKNAGRAGTIRKVMNAVKSLLTDIVSRAKEVLEKDPENKAALKAQRLAEAEKRVLQEEYFAHAEKAMETLRAAKENAAALSNEGAAKKVKFQLQEGEGTLEEQLNDNLDQLEKMEPVAQITGKEVAYGETPKENTDNIFKYFESIGGKVERTGFGTVELGKKGAKATVRHGNGPVKQSAIAAVPEVIRNGKQIGYAENWKGRGCNTYVFAAPVTIGGTEIYEAVIVNAYGNTKQGNKFYVHEVCGTDGNLLVLDDNGQIKQKQESADTVLKTEEGAERPGFPAKSSIAQKNAESKESDEPVKKNIRFQIDENFKNEVDRIDLKATWSKRIRVGSTSEVLQSIGVKDQNIYWDSGKIRKILQKHSAENFAAGVDDSIMTKEIIKQVPQVLESPVMVLHSDTGRNADYASRIYMFGEVYDTTGKPVDVSLELLPTSRKGLELDNIMVTSAYGKRNVQGLLNRDQILYIDPNKKRTDTWLAVNRLQLPLRITKYGSIASLRYDEGDVKSVSVVENETEKTKSFQLAEQASRDAKRNEQQQASRVIAEKAAALDTLSQFFGLTKGVTVSRSAVDELAGRWLEANGSKADRAKLAQETEVLVNYMKADGADMEKAQALAETLAGEIQDGATYRNSELWDEYPDLHKLEYTVNRDGKAKEELVKRYGSWSEAVAEARRHGVVLRQADGVRDGNPAQLYESLVNDRSAAGGTLNGESALWKAAAEKAGVAEALSFESTEWLDVLMNLHDAIKPRTMSQFADEAEYEDAKQTLAGRIIGDIMNLPQLTDAEAIFEGIQRNSLAMAKAAAGSDERAAEVEKGLKGVQKAQSAEFGRRLAQNRRAAAKNTEVQQVNQLQRQLDKNLRAMGAEMTNVGDLNEKLTVLRENYQREMKAEARRMKTERQQMLDEARLEVRKLRSENAELTRQMKGEQRRADRAEYSLFKQEDEVRERDLLNQQRAAEWYQEQGERLAIERQVMQQQRDEEIAVAKRVAEKRVQAARDGRKMDELKRGVRRNAAALNQMILRPSPGKYVSQKLILQAAEVAKLADQTMLNDKAVNRLTALQDSIRKSMGSEESPNAMTSEWKQSRVPEMITALRDDLTMTKQIRLDELQGQLIETETMPDNEKTRALRERIEKRIRETEGREYLPVTVDQMRMLKDITSAALHVIRNENKTVSLAKAEEVSKIAEEAADEVKESKGNHPGGPLDGVHNLLTKYNLDMLGAERVLRMLGGYKNGGQMEKIGKMLNDGQYRQTKITVEGEKLFADVTGKDHAKQAKAFAGPGADLVDMGLKDTKGNAVPLTHAQLCSLYMHLQNQDSLQHLMSGGMVVPDVDLYSKGDVEQAYQKGQTVLLGLMTDEDGAPATETILNRVEEALTDYDRAWCADMKEFFNNYTTKLINETSLQLVGYKRATVKNYFPIEVERSALATEIDGVKLDATIEGRGFLKNRVKSSQPILLEECSNVVQRSLRDTAAYAGLAAPIRDVQKILNAQVETEDGNRTLKGGIIKEQWGTKAVSYLDDLLTDLQTTQRKRSNSVSRVLGALRGNYAGAVLTLNPGVAIAQAASLPTAAAVLGSDTMAAVLPFVKNFSPKQKAALEAEIAQHGDVLLQWRQRGSGKGELQSIGKRETLAQKGMDKLPKALTGWINGMDEITVAALWEGSKAYVKNHTAEFEGAEVADSPAYWEAVNRMYQKTIEQTQPNYTVMQKAGIQRNPDEMVKTFTMFTTQRFQNAGILIDAVGDWKAQSARYKADATEENRAELKRATQQRDRAILSQTAQVAVFALMKIGADFLLHRWDREQDENGDVTLESVAKRFASLSAGSAMGNFLFGSELYNLIDNAIEGKDYDVISATNISAVNDLTSDLLKFTAEMKKDTSEMDEAELEKHHAKLLQKGLAFVEDGFEVAGVPYGNGRKIVEAIRSYAEDVQNVAHGGKFSFNSLPESATGQYDRLYNAYASGDADEARAAVDKLTAMGKEDEIYKQLKTRLKKYDPDIEAAAKAQMAGNDAERYQLESKIIGELYDVLDIRKGVKEDAPKREKVIDCVTGAVNALENELLKGESGDMYADLKEAADSWNAVDVQSEYDRLVRAGKDAGSIKKEITKAVKPEYLAGSDADKEKMADMLLSLTDAEGKALYTEKTFAQWEKDAEKAAQAEPEEDPYENLR